MSKELKPCPFCGREAEYSSHQDEDLSTHDIVEWKSVSCKECDIEMSIPDGYEGGTAIDRWNRRAEPKREQKKSEGPAHMGYEEFPFDTDQKD